MRTITAGGIALRFFFRSAVDFVQLQPERLFLLSLAVGEPFVSHTLSRYCRTDSNYRLGNLFTCDLSLAGIYRRGLGRFVFCVSGLATGLLGRIGAR